jgi:methylglutaconyl-CoA hydratase
MSDSPVLTDVAADGIATITFNRPQLHNAIDESVISGFTNGLKQLANDKAVRAVIVAGNGKSFCAGADLNWMKRTSKYSEDENYRDALGFTEILAGIDQMRVPTIAKVHGPAYGGGVGIVAACDIAIGTPDALFCFTEIRLGLIPAMISPYAVAVIGERAARRYMLTAERIDAAEALRIGLLHEVCDASALDARIGKIAEHILRGGPASIAASKRLIADVTHRPIDQAMREYTARSIASIRASSEGREGIEAFLAKRSPAWVKLSDRGDTR